MKRRNDKRRPEKCFPHKRFCTIRNPQDKQEIDSLAVFDPLSNNESKHPRMRLEKLKGERGPTSSRSRLRLVSIASDSRLWWRMKDRCWWRVKSMMLFFPRRKREWWAAFLFSVRFFRYESEFFLFSVQPLFQFPVNYSILLLMSFFSNSCCRFLEVRKWRVRFVEWMEVMKVDVQWWLVEAIVKSWLLERLRIMRSGGVDGGLKVGWWWLKMMEWSFGWRRRISVGKRKLKWWFLMLKIGEESEGYGYGDRRWRLWSLVKELKRGSRKKKFERGKENL